MKAAQNIVQEKQSASRFWRCIEMIILKYRLPIQYSILLFGNTKHGKTTISYYLSNIQLITQLRRGLIMYRPKDQSEQKQRAIGLQTFSETQIPNQFILNIQQNGAPVTLIDNPGYQDSYGIFRILSNAFFHYQIFSKVKNMKFILVLDYNGIIKIQGQYKQINNIFKEFLKAFKNLKLKDEKQRLIQATALVITKFQKEQKKDSPINRLSKYKKHLNEENNQFTAQQKDFICKLIEKYQISEGKKKLKIFYQAQNNKTAVKNQGQTGSQFLQQIYNNLKYYSRNQQKKQQDQLYIEKFIDRNVINFNQKQSIQRVISRVDELDSIKLFELFTLLSERGCCSVQILINFFQKLIQYYVDKIDNFSNQQQKQQGFGKFQKQLDQILEEFDKKKFLYTSDQKYKNKRQQVFKQIKESVLTIQKTDKTDKTFIQRLQLIINQMKILEQTAMDNSKQIDQLKSPFRKLLFSLLHVFNKSSHQKLSQFIYHMDRFFSQSQIFQLIMKGGLTKKIKGGLQNLNMKINSSFSYQKINITDYLKMNQQQKEQYKTTKKLPLRIIQTHLQKFNKLLSNQDKYSQELSNQLLPYNLKKSNQIERFFLQFKSIKKLVFKLKCDINNPNGNLTGQIKKIIIFQLKFLKQLKIISNDLKIKTFENFTQNFSTYNSLVWNNIGKMFGYLLKQTQNQDQIKKLLQIIIEMMNSGEKSSDIIQSYKEYLCKLQNKLNQINKKQLQSLKQLSNNEQTQRKKICKKIIQLNLNLAKVQKSIKYCQQARKYIEYCPEQIRHINLVTEQIKRKNILNRSDRDRQEAMQYQNNIVQIPGLKIFNASSKLKLLLGKFMNQNDVNRN